MTKTTIWVRTRSDTNQAVQAQKMDRGLKFWIKKVEEFCYSGSENKGADQRDLRLCFRICRLFVFSSKGSFLF